MHLVQRQTQIRKLAAVEQKMNQLLKKANIPDDGSMYIGKLIKEPFFSTMSFVKNLPEGFPRTSWGIHARPLGDCQYTITGGIGEIVLDTAERIPVKVTHFDLVRHTSSAIKSGRHKRWDSYFDIRGTDLTPEQAKRARYFVQPLSTTSSKEKVAAAQTGQTDSAI
jgi:hypothetical protein